MNAKELVQNAFETTHETIEIECNSFWYPDGGDTPAKIKYKLVSNGNGHFVFPSEYPLNPVNFATRQLAEDALNLISKKELTYWTSEKGSKICLSSDGKCISKTKRSEWETFSEKEILR